MIAELKLEELLKIKGGFLFKKAPIWRFLFFKS